MATYREPTSNWGRGGGEPEFIAAADKNSRGSLPVVSDRQKRVGATTALGAGLSIVQPTGCWSHSMLDWLPPITAAGRGSAIRKGHMALGSPMTERPGSGSPGRRPRTAGESSISMERRLKQRRCSYRGRPSSSPAGRWRTTDEG